MILNVGLGFDNDYTIIYNITATEPQLSILINNKYVCTVFN